MKDKNLPGSIIGYRKDGRPIRLQAGGDPTHEDPANEPQGKVFTEEELNRLLQRERDKLHGRIDKATTAQDAMKEELERLRKSDEVRAQAEEQARLAQEEATRKAAEAEMSAKELIDKRSRELQQQYEQQQNEWAARFQAQEQTLAEQAAVFAKEREFQELANYAAAQVNANQDQIAPELIDLIGGNSKEQIDASVASMIEQTQRILSGIQQAQTAQRAAMPGVSTGGFTPTGPMESQGGTRQVTPEEIAGMSMAEFAAHREQFGVTGNNGPAGRFGQLGKGLFG